jgi:branched-chain amino acid transport system substrate-binding protein
VILFGPGAALAAQSPQMAAALGAAAQHGRAWTLIPIESGQNWGAASTQLVHALTDEHALAIVALDRNAAHLSVQLALKSFVPVIALSNDQSLTSANIPWIFRLPAATAPASALRLIVEAAARNGAGPAEIRDALASGRVMGGVVFQPTGELRGQ